MYDYKSLLLLQKKASKFNGTDLKIWCNIRRKKGDGAMPTKVTPLKEFDKKLAGREPLTVKEFLMDQGYAKDLVDSVVDDPANCPTKSVEEDAAEESEVEEDDDAVEDDGDDEADEEDGGDEEEDDGEWEDE